MPEINPHFSPLVRVDALTSTGNHVGFFDWLINAQKQDPAMPFTLVSVALRGLQELNQNSGRLAGDTALRWAANVIKDQSGQPIFRMGNEFLAVFSGSTPKTQTELAKRIYDLLNQQAATAGLKPPAANVAAIVFPDPKQISPESILSAYYGALFFLAQKPEITFKVFDASQMSSVSGFIAYIVHHTISRFTSIGSMLDQSNQLAFIDPISGLPNERAAMIELEARIEEARKDRSNFSVLIADGDTLRQYNQFSYLGGDDLIRRLGETLRNEIRPTDFIARWRKGDQFLVLLPNSMADSAVKVGERMRIAVDEKSKEWMIRSTVSVGVATCPQHGKTAEALVEAAELALKRAKELGKNRVSVHTRGL